MIERILCLTLAVGLGACSQQPPLKEAGRGPTLSDVLNEPPAPPRQSAQGVQVSARTVQEDGAAHATGPENRPPKVLGLAPEDPQAIFRGEDLKLIPRGEDPDGDLVSYRYQWLVNGEEVQFEDGPVLKGDLFKRGDEVQVKVTPSDGKTQGDVFITMPLTIPNAPPRFFSEPPKEFRAALYAYQPVVEDPDGDKVSFSLAAGPEGMQLDPQTGAVNWKIDPAQAGEHTIELVAEDSLGTKSSQKWTMKVETKQ